jgi:hypothetical protein
MSSIDDLQARIASDYHFAHRLFFDHRHSHESPPFHHDMLDLYWSGQEQVVALCFRDAGKSTLVEETLIIKALIKDFDYAVIVAATERRASDRLLSISNELSKNEIIEEVFGDVRGETWHSTRIILSNGVCIDAIGAGQNTRGMKYLNARPGIVFLDDVENNDVQNDNVSTPEKREDLARWWRAFVPSMARPHRIILVGTMLHEESMVARCVRSPRWKSIMVPIEHLDEQGVRIPAWPDKFPLDWIDAARAEAEADGQLETFAQEYLCQAAAPQSRAFREEHLKFEDRHHTWEPVFVLYDPARTVGSKSDATGKVVASVIGGKIHVWEASANHWQPSELIGDIFATNEKYHPIAIGIEVTGLNQFIEQPLRQAQLTRGSLPLRPMNPPRGPGKEGFLLRLQPFFQAGEVIFCGSRQKFEPLIRELLGFPYGHDDVLNALAYVLEIKPGEAIHPSFMAEHVVDAVPPIAIHHGQKHLLLDSDGKHTVAILVSHYQGRTYVLADWCEPAAPGLVIPGLARTARAIAGGAVAVHAKQDHFGNYDKVGLAAAARASGLSAMRGGDIAAGREKLREMMKLSYDSAPLFQVSRNAAWTLRALSGGYAREPDKSEAMPGPYRLIGEALESFAASGMADLEDEGKPNRLTPDGRPFLSCMPIFPRRRERAPA